MARTVVLALVGVIALLGVVATTWLVTRHDSASDTVVARPTGSRVEAGVPITDEVDQDEEHERMAVALEPSESDSQSGSGAALAVHVVRPGGAGPVAGAELSALALPLRQGSQARGTHGATDEGGSARLLVPYGERILLEAVEPMSGVGVKRFLAPLVKGEEREVELVLAALPVDAPEVGTIFNGIAVDASGRPIAAAQVFVGRHQSLQWTDATTPSSKRPATETDAGGRFVVAAPMGESMAVRVQASGYWHAIAAFEPGHETLATAREMVLLAPASLVAHVGPLSPEELVDARVVCTSPVPSLTRDGEGVSFSMIFSMETMRWEATPDAQGRSHFERLPPGQALTLAVRGLPSTRTLTHPEFELGPGEAREVHLERGSGARVVGSVHDASGAPLPGVELALLPGEIDRFIFWDFQSDENLLTAVTDSGGGFDFEDVPDGAWTLGPRDGSALVLEPLSVTVADRRQDRELVLVGVLGLFISGRVQTRNGEPAPGAEVVGRAVNPWFGDSAEADSSGCFRIGPLPPGEYLLHANASNVLQSFAPENALRVHAGVEDIFLRLPEIGALNVRLISATGGKPIEGSLLISPGCVDGVPLGGSVHSFDAAGEVALENISFGRYDLVAWGGDGLVATAPRVNVPGAGGQPTTLAARRGGVVRLLGIAEEDFVYATHEDALVGVRGVLDENTLLLPEGPATIWRVRREAPQGPFESRTVDVTAGGDPIEVDFASGSGG